MTWRIALVLGSAKLIANSVYTGISEFLSSKAHREFLLTERRREMWEFKNYREDEINEVKPHKFNFSSNSPFGLTYIVVNIIDDKEISSSGNALEGCGGGGTEDSSIRKYICWSHVVGGTWHPTLLRG